MILLKKHWQFFEDLLSIMIIKLYFNVTAYRALYQMLNVIVTLSYPMLKGLKVSPVIQDLNRTRT
jgi:hypothetical protein